MKPRTLHEIAKFAAGLIAADFIMVSWLSSAHLLPATFLDLTMTETMVAPKLIFDVALFIVLVHYAWHLNKLPSLRERSYLLIVGTLLGTIALVHVAHVLFGFGITIGDFEAPLWLSWIGVAIATYLSYMSFHIAARLKK